MEETKKKKLGLASWIFIAMILGIVFGIVMYKAGQAAFVSAYIKPFGTIFVNLLKFIVVPVVLISIICGMISMDDVKKVGSVGWKTVVYYMCTTLVAIVIGLVVANLFKGFFPVLETTGLEYEAQSSNFMDTIVNIFPSNMWSAFVNANMLQVIVIALLFGAGILVCGEKATHAKQLFESLNEVVMSVMMFIIKLTPIGVFCLMANTVAVNGPDIVGSLLIVLAVAYLGYLLHLLIVYSVTVKTMGGLSPIEFFKGMVPAMIFAFTSTSSVATLPLTKECSENLGADKDVSSFVLPLGATINMDGTAIYMGVTSLFIATCYGIDLTLAQMATIVITATLASIGTAGVSGAGMIMLAMVLQSVGIPVEGIALIVGVDKLFDMGRTTLNIVGDASCAIVVSNWQKKKEAKLAGKE
ncbi:MAG: dicarboxylate/amino acid:cation symporter [Oscillospiraceae bacterium]|nr:dicarboxylate/amino acid:cation symporter [Oscillospiraceae bacterium]